MHFDLEGCGRYVAETRRKRRAFEGIPEAFEGKRVAVAEKREGGQKVNLRPEMKMRLDKCISD
jgi:hypothetical protein